MRIALRRRWALAGLLALLGGCEDSASGGGAVTCALLGETVAVGAVVEDPQAGLRCVCQADGEGRCGPLLDRGRPPADFGPDAAPPDRGPAADAAPPDAAPADAAPPDAAPPDAAPPDAAADLAPAPDAAGPDAGPPACAPGITVCVGADRARCGPDGRLLAPEPCPDGGICVAGGCEAGAPELVWLVDSSVSMGEALGEGMLEGFPACEAPAAPLTRLGRLKQALAWLFDGPAPRQARLALARMPQSLSRTFGCPEGHYRPQRIWPSFSVEPQDYTPAQLAEVQASVLAVPFGPGGGSDAASLAAWVNYDEVLEPNGLDCEDVACAGVCLRRQCQVHVDPELRATGDSVFGKALFVIASYLEQQVWQEGAACAGPQDCAAPYRCEAGRCQDPLGVCRQRAVVVFMTGPEVEDWDPTMSYFAPTVQAKRFQFGLGCQVPEHCRNGATCEAGRCRVRRCASDARLCGNDGDCPNSRCRTDDLPFFAESPWPLRSPGGDVVDLKVHVIDASGAGAGVELARWGGGLYVRTDDGPEALVAAFEAVIAHSRAETAACLAGR